MTKAIAKTDPSAHAVIPDGLSFEELAQRADVIEGAELVDKETLVGVEFLVIDAKLRPGEYGEFASLTCLLRDRSTVVINDGSTGIRDQIVRHLEGGGSLPLYCKKGLRRSDYKNEHGSATTYYLTSGRPKG